jgi:hypothetical protein
MPPFAAYLAQKVGRQKTDWWRVPGKVGEEMNEYFRHNFAGQGEDWIRVGGESVSNRVFFFLE